MASKLERFTQRARRVLSLAQDEAERMHHTYIDTEHLLIGLMREGEGIAADALRGLGLELPKVAAAVERLNPTLPSKAKSQIELASGTKKVLEYAVHEARRMGHEAIGTEHLLLGLVRQTTGNAVQALKQLGVSSEQVRREIRRIVHEKPVPPRETETVETEQAAEATPEAILEGLAKGTLTPAQAANLIEQSTALRLHTIQMGVFDLVQRGKATPSQALELMRPLHVPLSPLFMGQDMQRQLHFSVTTDDNTDAHFTLTVGQFQEMVQQVIASMRAGKTGTVINRQWAQGKRINVEIDDKRAGENPSAGV